MRWSMLLMCLLAACSQGLGPCQPPEKVAEFRFGIAARLPYVPVAINGLPAAMMIDTGANVSTLTRVAAERLGIKADGGATTAFTVAGALNAERAQVRSLAVGGLLVRNARLNVVDGLPMPGDGLLGLNILAAYQVELDAPRRTISLFRAQACRDPQPNWAEPFQSLEARRLPSGHLTVPVVANGVPLRAVLDTGAQATVLSSTRAASLGLAVNEPEQRPSPAGSAGRPQIGYATLNDLRIGASQAAFPVVRVEPLPGGTDAVVGEDFLSTRRVWLTFFPPRVFVADQPRPR